MADLRQFVFGPGVAWAQVATLLDGSTAVLPQPTRFDVLQSLALDFTFTTKELFGNNSFPEAIGIGNTKLSGKIVNGRMNSAALWSAAFGYPSNPSTGYNLMAISEAGTVPAVSTYVINTTNKATWTKDWGVRYTNTGAYLTPVTGGSEALGKYSVASGVYTFAAADANAKVLIDYEYTPASGGKTIAVSNFLQGQITLFGLRYQGVFKGLSVGIWVPNSVSSKFAFATKQQDFIMPEFDFVAYAGPDGSVASLYMTE